MARKAHAAPAVPAETGEADANTAAVFARDIWLYRGPEDAKIFRAGEAIPAKSEGWREHPGRSEAE
jgi:hypothetical protein